MEPTKAYQVLGLSPGCTRSEVDRAFRKRSRTCHPDLAGDSAERLAEFGEINDAHDALVATLPELTSARAAEQVQKERQREVDAEQRRRVMVPLNLTPDDLRVGGTFNLKVIVRDTCMECKGKKFREKPDNVVCFQCHGTKVQMVNRARAHECSLCFGTGVAITLSNRCEMCKATGTNGIRLRVQVEVKAGAGDGQVVGKVEGRTYLLYVVAKKKSGEASDSDDEAEPEPERKKARKNGASADSLQK